MSNIDEKTLKTEESTHQVEQVSDALSGLAMLFESMSTERCFEQEELYGVGQVHRILSETLKNAASKSKKKL